LFQLLASAGEGKLDKESEEFIELALDGAHRMQALINDCWPTSRVTCGRNFCARPYSEQRRGGTRNLKVAWKKPELRCPSTAPNCQGPMRPVRSWFTNLIGNAIKFHGKEHPRIETNVQAEGRTGNDAHDTSIWPSRQSSQRPETKANRSAQRHRDVGANTVKKQHAVAITQQGHQRDRSRRKDQRLRRTKAAPGFDIQQRQRQARKKETERGVWGHFHCEEKHPKPPACF